MTTEHDNSHERSSESVPTVDAHRRLEVIQSLLQGVHKDWLAAYPDANEAVSID